MSKPQDKEPPNKWKSHLASSGLPLEFEAAKILASKKFAVSADYSYARDDAGIVKDFSVDIEAMGFTPFRNSNNTTSVVRVLVECKYRVPTTKWLFLPDPNSGEYSSVTLGQTLHAVSEFSPAELELNATVPFDQDMVFCYKGVEVNERGDVFDKEIKHGISQLQYALPRLFTQEVMFWGGCCEDCFAFFYCPILLTNADLIVAREDIKVRDVEQASKLTDLGDIVPYFVLFQDYGPDFEKHCSKECEPLAKLEEMEQFRLLSELATKSKKAYDRNEWLKISKGLIATERYYLRRYFTQFVVCNFKSFPKLIDHLKRTTQKAISKRKKRC
jgi:hypothetical protein